MAAIVERPSPLTGLAHSGIAVGAVAFILFRKALDVSQQGSADFTEYADKLLRFGVFGVLGIGLLTGLIGIGIWRATTFVVDDTEFRIDRKLLWSSSSRIEYTKVQAVEISQPFFARLLGLAKIHIDVGGSGGIDLAFLSLKRAEALRKHLLDRTKLAPQATVEDAAESDSEGPAIGAAAASQPATPETVLLKVRPTTLLLGNLVSAQLFPLLLAAAFTVLVGLLDRSFTVIAAALILIGWAHRQFAGNWNFTVTSQDKALRITRGLFSTHTQSVIPSRVQGVAIEQDFVQQLTGLYRVRVTVLGHDFLTEDSEASSNIVLPYGTWQDVALVVSTIWPDLDLHTLIPQKQPEQAKWLTPLSFNNHWWAVNETAIAAQHGLAQRTITIVPHRRMQSLGIQQGPLQKKLGLATIDIHTTDGPAKLQLFYLDQGYARCLFDHQLLRGRTARSQET